jgi:hypothetical protein
MAVVRILRVLHLRRSGSLVRFAGCPGLLGRRPGGASSSSIEGMVWPGHRVDHGAVLVDVVHVTRVDAGDRSIVVEHAVHPSPPSKTGAEIAVSVVDPAAEAYSRAPISGVPGVVDRTAVAHLISEIGCYVKVGEEVTLVREKEIDVLVRDPQTAPVSVYLCERKFWSKPIPQEVTHFRTVLSDFGAHGAFIISRAGIQACAKEGATN